MSLKKIKMFHQVNFLIIERFFMKSIIFIFIISINVFLIGCGSSDDSTISETLPPPDLPTTDSLTIDLSTFSGSSSGKKLAETTTFNNAVVTGGIINVGAATIVAIPSFVFAGAKTVEGVLEDDGYYHWRYSVNSIISYSCDIRAKRSSSKSQVIWEGYISYVGVENAKLFDGTVDILGAEGSWKVYGLLDSSEQASIDWTNDSSNSKATVSLKVTDSSNKYFDSTIAYVLDGTTRTITFFNSDTSKTYTMEWDSVTTAGSLTSPDFNSGVQSFWDANHEDITQ